MICFLQLTPIGTTIFQGIQARDADAGVNGLAEYAIVPGDGRGLGTDDGIGRNRITTADGYGFFSIKLPHQGQVTVAKNLDYERTQRFLVTVVASVTEKYIYIFHFRPMFPLTHFVVRFRIGPGMRLRGSPQRRP